MKNSINGRNIKVGIAGASRGAHLLRSMKNTGLEAVALCDTFKAKLDLECAKAGVRGYENFDEFLQHDMDAVVIATPFPNHAPLAMKALRAGKHVLSETSCNATMAEGVAL